MTTPPPEEHPHGQGPADQPPPGAPAPNQPWPQPGPYGPQYGYGYGYSYWNPPPPPKPPSRISIGMVFAGCAVSFVINFFVGFVFLAIAMSASPHNNNGVVAIGAVALAFIAFGVGGGLLAVRNRYAKGIGLGLMLGWAITTVVTVGLCTGLHPQLYSAA